jgi:hypothetical protein
MLLLFIMLYFKILLHCIDLTLEFLRHLSATSFAVPLLDTIPLHVSVKKCPIKEQRMTLHLDSIETPKSDATDL